MRGGGWATKNASSELGGIVVREIGGSILYIYAGGSRAYRQVPRCSVKLGLRLYLFPPPLAMLLAGSGGGLWVAPTLHIELWRVASTWLAFQSRGF